MMKTPVEEVELIRIKAKLGLRYPYPADLIE
jgi:hypothetical protein